MADALDVTDPDLGPTLLGGKYLTFLLDGQEYALDILRVREIVGARRIVPCPKPTTLLRGTMNLRGQMVPVFDLHQTGASPNDEAPHDGCTIIALTHGVHVGIAVDQVLEVFDVDDRDIEDTPPPQQLGVPLRFVSGVVNVNDRRVVLLDIGAVFREAHLESSLFADSPNASAE